MSTFVFMHVGDHLDILPKIFVASIHRTHKNPEIIQCSDEATKVIPGVTKIARLKADSTNLMTFRLKAFSSIKLQKPAIYCDSDMAILKTMDPASILGENQIAVCRRSYNTNGIYGKVEMRGYVYEEHKGETWDEAYPYLACFNVTQDYKFWEDCYQNLLNLDKKWHFWLGDQEAMRNIIQQNNYSYKHLNESEYAQLPDEADKGCINPSVIHFKGRTRKQMMLDWAVGVGIINGRK